MKTVLLALALGLTAGAAFAQEGDAQHGAALYERWCVACHGAGPGHPGTQALEKKYGVDNPDTPAVIAERQNLPLPMLTYFIRNGVSIMPFFRQTELTDQDIGDIAAYIAENANR